MGIEIKTQEYSFNELGKVVEGICELINKLGKTNCVLDIIRTNRGKQLRYLAKEAQKDAIYQSLFRKLPKELRVTYLNP